MRLASLLASLYPEASLCTTGDLVLSMPQHDRLMGEGTRVVAVVTLSACPRPGTMPLRQRVGRGGAGHVTEGGRGERMKRGVPRLWNLGVATAESSDRV